MRRPAMFSIVASILAGIIFVAVTLGAISSTQAWGPGTPPPASPEAEDIWHLDVVVPTEEVSAPAPYVTKVTFAAGDVQVDAKPHLGPFVFTVTEGAICYTYTGAVTWTTATVIASVTDNVPAPACAGARTDCIINTDCVLAPGDVVYLPTGSWITQSNSTKHRFSNVGDVTAVVYISGSWIIVAGTAPCTGSCPRP